MRIEFNTELFPYQHDAYEKLKGLKVGALYMEQGTGKTRTTLELINNKLEKGKIDSVLWLCPCSVKRNLKEDIEYHCKEYPENIVIRGIESISGSDRLFIKLLKMVEDHNVFLVVDESNLIKNPNAVRTKRIQQIANHCKYKIILNGTPASKNEADMFAQWYILDWRILGYQSYYSFAHNHLEYYKVKLPNGREITTDRVVRVLNKDYLTQKIAPYTYQILKKDCLKLPRKTYRRRYFQMTVSQRGDYEDTKSRFLEQVDEIKSETVYKLFTALQHVSSGRRVVSEATQRMKTENIFSDIEDNPRIQCLSEVLDEIGEEKAIIFAKYQSEAGEILELLQRRGQSAVEFTGHVRRRQRDENRKLFAGDTQFLIANKMCGAYGLNMQFCRNVIFYSNDFDFATRAQAEDRVHRIGQTREVHIYDIVAENGIDQMIVDNLDSKESMVAAFKEQIEIWKDDSEKKIEEIINSSNNK